MGGKSSKQTVGYWYQMDVLATFAIKVDEVVEIQFGERTGWTGSVTESGTVSIYKEDLFGGEKREGGVYGQVDMMFGEPTLPINEFLGSSMRKSGITNAVPAYRNTFSMFFRGVDAVNPEFSTSGVFAKEAETPPLITSGFTFKTKTPPPSFRWSALNPYFKPFRIKARRHTKDWHPEIAKINFTSFDNGASGYEVIDTVDQIAYEDNGYTGSEPLFRGKSFITDTTTIRVRFNPDGEYKAWSPWNSDTANGGNSWTNKLSVYGNHGDGVLNGPHATFWDTTFPTADLAAEYAAANPITFESDGSFSVGIADTPLYDDRGGLSVIVEILGNAVDMNPAHIIRECLTNQEWGMGYPTADIDDANFYAVAQTLYDEKFGISLKWAQQTTIEDFIMLVLRHINGVVTQDRSTGKLLIKLIRNDYVIGSLPSFDQNNCVLESYSRVTVGEMVNEVTLKYTRTDGTSDSITVHNLASLIDGQTVSQDIDLPGIRNPELAARVAQRELESRIKPIAKLTITTDRRAFNLYEADVFKFSWADHGIVDMVCRVVSVNLGSLDNNRITIEAVQDVFGFPTTSYVKPATSDWVDPIATLAPSPYRYITETPYYDIARSLSAADLAYLDATDCYVDVFAKEPSADALGYNLWSAAGSADLKSSVIASYAGMTTLTVALAKEETSVLHVLDIGQIVNLIETDTACLIVNGEYMHITDYDVDAGTITVNRGVLDTVPIAHIMGSVVILDDTSAGQDGISYIPTEVVKIKAQTHTSRGDLSINNTPQDTYTINQRQYRPYPPGKLRVNGNIYPSTIVAASGLNLTWVHRNRLTQTASIIDQATGTITPEVGNEYTLRIYGSTDTLLRTVNGLTGESYSYTTLMETADGGGYVIDTTPYIDAWWDKTKLLLNFNGTNASTTFVDNSPNFMTVFGNAQISTAQSKFGGASGYFNGASDRLVSELISNFATDDFTIEMWVRRQGDAASGSNSSQHLFDMRSSEPSLQVAMDISGSVGGYQFGYYVNGVYRISGGVATLNTWIHVALVRSSGVTKLYVDGTQVGSSYTDTNNFTGKTFTIGGRFAPVSSDYRSLNGCIDDFRITKGVARYTFTFTPPTSELVKYTKGANFNDNTLMLTFDGTNGQTTTEDGSDLALPVSFNGGNAQISTAQSKFGGSSLYLDGTAGTFVSVGYHSSHLPAAANITAECFFYLPNVTTGHGVIVGNEYDGDVGNNGWSIIVSDSGHIFARGSDHGVGNLFQITSPINTILANTWYHVALVRNSTTWTLYLDGVSIGSTTESGLVVGDFTRIGKGAPDHPLFTGYIDEVRFRSVAAYTSTFTPPTVSNYVKDSNWADTVALLNFNGFNGSTEIENIAEITKTMTAVGNAQISTAQFKFGGASGYFDGAGDYLTYPNSTDFSANSGDFTVEAWIRPATLSTIRCIATKRPSGGGSPTEWEFYTNASGQLAMVAWNSGGSVVANIVGTTVMTVDTWYHVAICRQGNTWRLFVNGVVDATGTQSGTVAANTALLYIGYDPSTAGVGRDWNGYIDDLRITRGARYVANFTAPDNQLSKITAGLDPQWDNVDLLLNFNGTNGSTTFTDSSVNARTITNAGSVQTSNTESKFGGTSGYFNGASRLSTGLSTGLVFKGDFTIEAWCFLTADSAVNGAGFRYASIFSIDNGTNATALQFAINGNSSTTGIGLTFWDGSTSTSSTGVTISKNEWHHLAVCRKDGSLMFFVDGVLISTHTKNGNIGNSTYSNNIGGRHLNTNFYDYVNGYIDDFRITKYARYTSTFTLPVVQFGQQLYSASSLNSQLRFELESKRDGLTSWTKHNHTVVRV